MFYVQKHNDSFEIRSYFQQKTLGDQNQKEQQDAYNAQCAQTNS